MATRQTQKGAREMILADLEKRKEMFVSRNLKNPGLWDDEIKETEIMIRRIKEGEPLTRWQRGLPQD
jgi:hypothetical protein